MGKLQGQIAVITGGNSGMGLATAELFQKEGAKVIVTARSAETYDKAKKEWGHVLDVVKADVTNLSELDELYSYVKNKYGKIDILFANAGIGSFLPTELVDEANFDSQFNTNVKGLYFSVSKAIPLLSSNAKIILNASTLSTKGMLGASVYSATKAAVRSFGRTWANELAPKNIRVNVLSPGPIETPIYGKLKMTDEQIKGLTDSVALKRIGSSEEIARIALFLGSDDSSFITGSDIVADGGFSQL